MDIYITGGTGLIGVEVAKILRESGDRVHILRRSGAGPLWDPFTGAISPLPDAFSNAETPCGFVHLAGEGIADHRWTRARKRVMVDSRVEATRKLAGFLASQPVKPAVFVSASAIGYYGDREDEILTESSARGEGFLSDLVAGWEGACAPLNTRVVRTVQARLGVVLSSRGGALARMLPAFRLGLGGALGSGRQWLSWISLEDAARGIVHCLRSQAMSGPVNVVGPVPERQADFARTLGRFLGKPAFLPAPAWALRLAFGEMADALLLSSQRVEPRKLLANGFRHRHEELETALFRSIDAAIPTK